MVENVYRVLYYAVADHHELGRGEFVDPLSGLCCALGTLGLRRETRNNSADPAWRCAERWNLAELDDNGTWRLTILGQFIANKNDQDDSSPKKRHQRMLQWLEMMDEAQNRRR